MPETLEWWPDYGGCLFWKPSGRGGEQVDVSALGLPADLDMRLAEWNRGYDDDKLPIDGDGDPDWLGQGNRLLAEVRTCLTGKFTVKVAEPWWDESLQA